MLTAAQARAITGHQDQVGAILEKIEAAIRKTAQLGRSQTLDISALVPQPHSGAWMQGQSNDTIDPIAKALTDAGYEIETYPGGPRGRGYINVSWAA